MSGLRTPICELFDIEVPVFLAGMGGVAYADVCAAVSEAGGYGTLGMAGCPPEEIRAPARVGLLILTPWTWSIAYRRFQQGVLIRYGRSRRVGVGTVIRVLTVASTLTAGYLIGSIPGIAVGTAAIAAGVIAEAVFIGISVRPVLRRASSRASFTRCASPPESVVAGWPRWM